MRYLSVCSGIEAASVAWHPIGWEPAAFAEIESFPSAVLKHHYPHVPNLGDITKFKEWPSGEDLGGAIDLVCGGTPCQSFSVAGLRQGLADPRGNLALTFLAIVDRYRPRWVLWENVPGVLSDDGGRSFGSILGGLGRLGYGWAYRVLDAQYVRVDGLERAVPQRRRRVFVVGCLGDWAGAAAVLFEPESVLGDTPPRRQAGQGVAPTISRRPTGGGGLGTDFDCDGGLIADALRARTPRADRGDEAANLVYIPDIVSQAMSAKWSKQSSGPAGDEVANLVAHSLRADGFDASEQTGKASDGEPMAFLLSTASASHNDCVLWPYAKMATGYGSVRHDGKTVRVHRRMCEITHGLATSQDMDAAHSCGNRLCINPNHLRWATRAENMADAIAHGTTTRGEKHGASRLTEENVKDIFDRLRRGETHEGIAVFYDVARTTITDIAKGKNWAWLSVQPVAHTLKADGFDSSEDGTGRGTPLVPIAFDTYNQDAQVPNDSSNIQRDVRQGWAVRRLMPVECEKLQGFPPGYTDVPYRGKPAADGPRYKALGNSMACNVMRWIGRRIEMVEELMDELNRRGG